MFSDEPPELIQLNNISINCVIINRPKYHIENITQLIHESKAIVFHWRDINENDLPKYHPPGQPWVLYNLESPQHTLYGERAKQFYDHQINARMTYRMDSEVPAPYGRLMRLNQRIQNWKPKIDFGQKTGQIAWIVSNCHTLSKREKLVDQLKKYIQIDVYGACGPHKCGPYRTDKCYQIIEKKYKFYLSFENSVSTLNVSLGN